MNMKKITLLLTLLILGCGTSLFAQSLVFVQNGEVLKDGSTIVATEIFDADIYPTMDAHIYVKNQTSNDVHNATMTISLVEESSSEGFIGFCGWGTNGCVPVNYNTPVSRTTTVQAETEVNPDVEALGVNPESISFKVEYKLTYGENTQIIYVIFTSDATAIPSLSKTTPIVVSNNVNGTSINYNFESAADRKLSVYSIIGTKITEINLTNNSGNIQLSNLTKGIYMYSVTENKRPVQSGKFIAK